MRVRWGLVAASAMMVAIAGCGDADREPAARRTAAAEDSAVPPIDPVIASALPQGISIEMVEAGRRPYRDVCAPCHGPAGEGTQLGPPLADAEWIHGEGGYDEIIEITRQGVASPEHYPIPMPILGGGGFDDDALRAVAAYTFALRHGAR